MESMDDKAAMRSVIDEELKKLVKANQRVADHPITRIAELLPWNASINKPAITSQA